MTLETAIARASSYLDGARALHARYLAGEIRVRVPESLREAREPLESVIARCLPASKAALDAAARSLFFSLPVAFDPEASVGPYLATVDRDEAGAPWRFLDMGALIATHAFGENDPTVIEAVLAGLPYAVARYAHSEYQTVLSLRLKAALGRIAPQGTPRHFVVNTGAEAVENAIKAVLLNRVKTTGESDGTFIISFDGAFHGRTLGALAVTHRKKARLGFPTFDWPHVAFPTDDPTQKEDTLRREEQSLRQIWDLIVTGRLPHAPHQKEIFRKELAAIDAFLASPRDLAGFLERARAAAPPEVLVRARRAAGVLVEPVQGEGGVRLATPRFFQRLRLLTRIYDVPLMFDEVQTGWGACGTLWAHELFSLPLPPDVVVWAKKFQNGVLFVSEELATFFQEEKKFNTTWEGDSVGMLRFLAVQDKLDLEQVRRTGARARAGLDALAHDFPEFLQNVRGAGVMLALDVVRSDWRDVLRDRAFRLGLILLPAGERALRFYPRYDIEIHSLDEALALLRRAVEDTLTRRDTAALGPNLRVGTFDVPLASLETIDVTSTSFDALRAEIVAVEVERYGATPLRYDAETLEATLGAPRALGVALRDRVSGRIVAYGLGSPLENHDETGVLEDPHRGEGSTFYLQALAVLPSVQNASEVENVLLEQVRARAGAEGYKHLSALIEEQVRDRGPDWLRKSTVVKTVPNYLRSGIRFVYLQADVDIAPSRS